MVGRGAGASQDSVLRLAWPLVISFTLRSSFTLVDTFYAATLGDSAVAAIGLAIPIELLFIALWVGTSNALTSLLGRAVGAGEHKRIDLLKRAAFRLAAGYVPLFVSGGIALYTLADSLGLGPEVAADFAVYGGVLMVGTGLTGFWSIVPDSVIKAYHDTRSTMVAGLLSNVVNLALNTLFLFVFSWGLFGIALSTVLGRLAGLAYALRRARTLERAQPQARASRSEGHADARPVRLLLSMAVPSGLGFVLIAVEVALANWLLGTLAISDHAIAAFSIYQRFLGFGLTPLIAMSVALLPFVARHAGEQRYDLVWAGVRQALVAGFIMCVFILLPGFLLAAPALAGLLADGQHTHNLAVSSLCFAPLACLLAFPYFIWRPILEGTQQFMPGLVVAALRHVVLAAPCGYLGMRFMDASPVLGLVAGLAVAAGVGSATLGLWARSRLLAMGRFDRSSSVG